MHLHNQGVWSCNNEPVGNSIIATQIPMNAMGEKNLIVVHIWAPISITICLIHIMFCITLELLVSQKTTYLWSSFKTIRGQQEHAIRLVVSANAKTLCNI